MKCVIRSNNVELPQSFRRQVIQKIESTFERVNEKVRYVVVSFQDVNGTRGGVDKQCKVKVIGHTQLDVQVVDIKGTPNAAFSVALNKAHRTFLNRAKKLLSNIRRKYPSAVKKDVELSAELSQ